MDMNTHTSPAIIADDDTVGFTPVHVGGLVLAAAVGGGLGLMVGGAYAVGYYQGSQSAQTPPAGNDKPKDR